MTSMGFTRAALVVAFAGALCGCGGAENSNFQAFTAPVSGGIYHGTDSISGANVFGIMTEGGDFRFILENDVQYAGKTTTDSTDKRILSGPFEAFTEVGTMFTDGSTHGTGTLAGVLDSRATLKFNTQFVTDVSNSAPFGGTLDLKYDKLYDRTASTLYISGVYTVDSSGSVMSVATDGTVFAQLSATCVVNGKITVPSEKYNAYAITLTYTGCGTTFDGVELSGLVTLDNSVSPERMRGAVSGTSGASTFGLVLSYPRS